ncbi:MAG: serine/threonine protein kinase [Deltaproteobacteria bacterium]|nr:serine/threonine protein kinase [Deltaproteobacteria bacterium]
MNHPSNPVTPPRAADGHCRRAPNRLPCRPTAGGCFGVRAAACPPASSQLGTGSRVADRYVILDQLGGGAQGAVWRARDLLTGERVALKLVPIPGSSSTDLARIRREARILAVLQHPSLVRCRSVFEEPSLGVLGFAMEVVDGQPLAEWIEDERLTCRHRELLLTQVARALAYVHARGLAHRDLKPENILVTYRFWNDPADPANVKLVDFGIACPSTGSEDLTRPGFVLGTPPYMAPEQLDPLFWGPARSRAAIDVFALGLLVCALFRLGHPTGLPASASMTEYAAAYRNAWRTGARRLAPNAGGSSVEVVARCLALSAADRFADGGELVATLCAARARAQTAALQVARPACRGPAAACRTERAMQPYAHETRAWGPEVTATVYCPPRFNAPWAPHPARGSVRVVAAAPNSRSPAARGRPPGRPAPPRTPR